MFDPLLLDRARAMLARAEKQGVRLAAAESCTGGLLSGLLTEIPGCSACFERGFVTYSNKAKEEMLGVPAVLIAAAGAVSEAVARAMAEGALARSSAHIAVSITGIAGPDGGSAEKPVGLVHFAAARRGKPTLHLEKRFGDLGRDGVRRESVNAALAMFEAELDQASARG